MLHERSHLVLRDGDEGDRVAELVVRGSDLHEERSDVAEVLKDVQCSTLRLDLEGRLLACLPGRMRFDQQLRRDLSEVLDHSFDRLASDRIFDGVDVHRLFVRAVHEDVQGVDGRLPGLFVAEDQIDPFVQMSRDVVRLQGQSMQTNELFRGLMRPGRELNVLHGLMGDLQFAQIESVVVAKKLGQVEELGNQFLHVVGRVENVRPGGLKGMELSIGDVELATVQLNVKSAEGFGANQVVHDTR